MFYINLKTHKLTNLTYLPLNGTLRYCHLNYPVQAILKNTIGFFYIVQREAMSDKRRSIYLPVGYQAKYLRTVASIHTSGLVRKVRFLPYISGNGSNWGES